MEAVEVEASDVIKLIQQFLRENNLTKSLAALQDETGVIVNTVESVDALHEEICNGKWDSVLRTASQAHLSTRVLVDLYEQIILELTEMRELDVARNLLRQTEVMQHVRDRDSDRFLRLEQILAMTHFDARMAYPDGDKNTRRSAIAKAVCGEMQVAPAGRLLSLLSQAIQWQQEQGLLPMHASVDILTGISAAAQEEVDTPPVHSYATIKFGKKSHPECACFSPDGQYFVTGSVDGFIEVWDHLSGALRTDLAYQNDDNMMSMSDAVLALKFNTTSDLLVSGSQSGQIKVWNVATGECVNFFQRAHSMGVTSLAFSRDGSQILSTSFDQLIRLHGMKSGKLLKEFRGHQSFVNVAFFSADKTKIVSGGSDGCIKIWNLKTTECLQTILPPATGITVQWALPVPNSPDRFVACYRNGNIVLMSMKGHVCHYRRRADLQVIVKMQPNKKMEDVVSVVASPQGDYLYALTIDGWLCIYKTHGGTCENKLKVADTASEFIGMTHHPRNNILALFSDDGLLNLWKP